MKPNTIQRSSSHSLRKAALDIIGTPNSFIQIREGRQSASETKDFLQLNAEQPENPTLILKRPIGDESSLANLPALGRIPEDLSYIKKNMQSSLDQNSLCKFNTTSQEVSGIENSDLGSARKEIQLISKLLHPRKLRERAIHSSLDMDENSNLGKGSLYASTLSEVEENMQLVVKSASNIQKKRSLNLSHLKPLENVNDQFYIKESLRKSNRGRERMRNGVLQSLFNAVPKESYRNMNSSIGEHQVNNICATFITNPKPFQYLPVYVKMDAKELSKAEENQNLQSNTLISVSPIQVQPSPKKYNGKTHRSNALAVSAIKNSDRSLDQTTHRTKLSINFSEKNSLLVSK